MNVFELFAKLGLDTSEYEKELKGAESKLSTVGGKLSSIGGKIASGIGTAMKVGAAAVGAASTAVGALATKSVTAYADYEQMVGGVQKLYGTMGQSLEEYAKAQGKSIDEVRDEWTKLDDAQNLVLKNAQNAYKTAGMSANQYMEIATSFSASLINSLDGDSLKAAEATDKAMRAISDNWNTFGGDIGMIQGAFQGFAKGNYTMLDNLKLGYGGTKEEMEKLIADANEYAKTIGEAGDLSMDSFADIVTAIDLVQQKQNIAGTTAREASTTISGSLGMAKAAWENLVTGMSDSEADLDSLMNNLVDSIIGYTDKTGEHVNGVIDNILPVAEQALNSVGTLIEKLAPKLGEEIPKLVESILPSLLSAGANIVTSLAAGITDTLPNLLGMINDILKTLYFSLLDYDWESAAQNIVNVLMEGLDDTEGIVAKAIGIIQAITDGITQSLPILMPAVTDIIIGIGETLIEEAPLLIESAFQLILQLALGIAQALPELIPMAVEAVVTFAESLIDNVDLLIDGAIALVVGLAEGIINALPILIEKAPEIVLKLTVAIIKAGPKILAAAAELIIVLIRGILQTAAKLAEVGKQIVDFVKGGFMSHTGDAKNWGRDMIQNFINGVLSKWNDLRNAVSDIAGTVRSYLHFSEPDVGPLSDFSSYAPDMMKLFAEGIADNEKLITDQISKSFNIESAISSGYSNIGQANVNNQPVNVTVVLKGDAEKLFTVLREENRKFTKSTGVSAFA